MAGRDVDLVFSDVRMPGSIDGLGLLKFLKTHFPDLPVILASGHLEPGAALAEGARHFLPKPYQISLALRLISSELPGSA